MRRTNFRFPFHSRDDVQKLTCTLSHGGHASTPVFGNISGELVKLVGAVNVNL